MAVSPCSFIFGQECETKVFDSAYDSAYAANTPQYYFTVSKKMRTDMHSVKDFG